MSKYTYGIFIRLLYETTLYHLNNICAQGLDERMERQIRYGIIRIDYLCKIRPNLFLNNTNSSKVNIGKFIN